MLFCRGNEASLQSYECDQHERANTQTDTSFMDPLPWKRTWGWFGLDFLARRRPRRVALRLLHSSNRSPMNRGAVWMMPWETEGHNAQVPNLAQTGWQQMVLCLAGSPGLQSRLDISQDETCEQALLECRSWCSLVKRQGHERLVNTGSCSCWALMDKWSSQRAHFSPLFIL